MNQLKRNMGTKINAKTILKSFFFIISFFSQLINSGCIAQTVDWRSVTWIQNEYGSSAQTVSQKQSDYDWWYDHCTGYETNGTPIGYIAAGVGKYRCAERSGATAPLVYDENPNQLTNGGCAYYTAPLDIGLPHGSYDYSNWENEVSGKLGFHFNQIGKINPDGSKGYIITMNMGGEYLRTRMLQDGTFMTVGHTYSTRKRIDPPQNGMPLFYNPTFGSTNSNAFNYGDIYTINVNGVQTSINQNNVSHWDIMKFNGSTGECLMNSIYGMADFNATGSFTRRVFYPSGTISYNNLDGKENAYFSDGEAKDFIQIPSNTNNGDIGVVGWYRDNDVNQTPRAAIIKIDNNGNILQKKYIDLTAGESTCRAIEFGMVDNVPCFITAISVISFPANLPPKSFVRIIAQPIDLSLPEKWHKDYYPSNLVTNSNAMVWGLSVSNNKLFVPLITNCSQYDFSGNNFGNLRLIKIDLETATEDFNVALTNVRAFDLKARSTVLTGGDIAVVSSILTQPWLSKYGPSVFTTNNSNGIQICSYIFENPCPSDYTDQTIWWNTDTYLTRINPTTGNKMWETSFDADAVTPSTVLASEFPYSATSGGENPKHQECMYGISEAPDGGIVVSGNMSANLDDNYMAKYRDCNALVNYTFTSYTQALGNGTHYWNESSNPWGSAGGSIKILNELRIAAGATVQATDMIFEFAPNARLILEPGAKLKLEGCTLTGSIQCNTMWQGISMLGTYGVNQHAQNSYLELLDNNGVHSTIKNAIVGISNWDETSQSSPGGKVYAYNAIFENNKIAASFVEDGHGNTIVPQCPNGCRNLFLNCEFKMTAAKLLPPYQNIGVEAGISLNNVHDVDIDCSTSGATKFTGFNSTTGRMGKAIVSIDSEFEASKITFTNCDYGINCESSIGAAYSPHFFTENTFNNCYYGIRMRNGLNDQISDNTFNPNAGAYSRQKGSTLPNKYGVFLDASSGTKILGNTFTNLEYGLTIVNSGANGAIVSRGIYGNTSTFTNCFRGLNTLGNNSKVSVKCTNFSSNTSALGFGAHWYISGDLKDQGLAASGPIPGSPAGNTFQHNSGIDIIAVKNTASFKYYYKINSSVETPTIAGLATIIPVNGIAVCNSPELMVLAGNEPALAEQLISDETDDELKAIYVSQLSFWYENQGQEQERIALLIAQNEEYANEQLLPLLMEREEYQAAMDLLQDYLGTGNSENDDYYSVNAMQLEWALNAKTAFDMTSSEEATLRDIAEHFTRAAASARVILNQVFNDQYEAPYYSDSSERKANFEEEIIAEQNGTIAGIAPNPANNEAIISYKLFEGIETAELQIWNMTGQLVKKITLNSNETQLKFETKQLVGTIYIIKLICNSVLIDKQKLVIQH